MVRLDPHDHTTIENFLTDEECSHIAYILTRDEHKILSIPHTIRGNDYEGLTAKHTVYNILNHADIRPLRIPERLFEIPLFKPSREHWYDELWIQAWGNVLHQGQNINLHCHEDNSNPLFFTLFSTTTHNTDLFMNYYVRNDVSLSAII